MASITDKTLFRMGSSLRLSSHSIRPLKDSANRSRHSEMRLATAQFNLPPARAVRDRRALPGAAACVRA